MDYTRRRVLADEAPTRLAADVRRRSERAFALLEHGLGDDPADQPSPEPSAPGRSLTERNRPHVHCGHATGVRWRLGGRTRKGVLLVHIASTGTWLGIDVVMAVLVFTALGSDDDRTKALSFRALELVAVWPLLAMGLLCLFTGDPARASGAATGWSATGGWRSSWP